MSKKNRFAAKNKRTARTIARRLLLESLETRLAMDASLSGFVFVDANGDGVRDASELGVPGTVIRLSGTDASGSDVALSTLTLGDGSYTFDAMPGIYEISERQPPAMADGLDSTSVTGATVGDDLISDIALADGQNLGGNNFGELGLRPEFLNVTWFFSSRMSRSSMLRETIALSEELNGDSDLADSIRDGASDVPDAINLSPVAVNDDFTTNEGMTLTITADVGVLDNDSDPNSDALTASLVDQASNGTATLNADGSFTYMPDQGFTGADSFTYRVSDGIVESNPATVTVTVISPSEVSNTFNVDENSANATVVGQLDPEGEIGQPRIFEIDDPARLDELRLAPDDHLSGNTAAPVVLIEYLDLQCPACQAIHPVVAQLEQDFADDLLVVRRHLPLTDVHPNAFAAAQVAEAADRQGRFQEVVDILFERQDEWGPATDPQPFFETYITELGLDLNQLLTDIQDPAIDARINRDSAAAGSLGATGTPTFFLSGQRIGNPPTLDDFAPLIQAEVDAVDDVFSVDRLSGNILVADSAALDFETTPTFSLTVNATNGNSATIDATINLNDLNESPPVPQADSYMLEANNVLTISAANGVLANDTDLDNSILTATRVSGPAGGNVSLGSDGSFTYTPDLDFTGIDSFVYEASDGDFSETAIATITVTAVNNAPVAVVDVYEADEDTGLQVAAAVGVLENDTDDGNVITAQLVDDPANGTVSLNSDGSFIYFPATDFDGQDVFTYQASDGSKMSDVTTVTINVIDQNAFRVVENATEGTSVGVVTPEAALGSGTVFEIQDSTLPAELALAADDHLSGNPAAKVVLIEYLDLQCPFCQAIHPVVEQLEQDFPDDVLVVRRHFPLTDIHQNAFAAATVAEAAGRQGMFLEMVDLLFEQQDEWDAVANPQPVFDSYANSLGLNLSQLQVDMNDPAISDRILRDRDAAVALGVPGTPGFFLNGELISTPTSFGAFSNLVTTARDAHDDTFLINRETGRLLVANSAALDFEAMPMPFNLTVRATNGTTEVINATISLVDQPEGEGESARDTVFAELDQG